MTRRTKRNAGLVTIVAAVVASSLINLASATTARDTADVKEVQLRDLGQKTDECVTSSTSTDTPACAKAAAKAKEVQAQPVVVNVPRRTDAEVKALGERGV